MIARSSDASLAVAAWRSAVDDRFDFAIQDVRLEVKASGDRMRVHHLSAEQCQPPVGTVGTLASIFVESSGGGTSLQELIRQVEERLAGHDELALKVQETVAETLGEALPTALSMRFDDRLARSSLQLYDLSVVPAIRQSIPKEVTQIRFRSDLTSTPTVTVEDLAQRSDCMARLLPRT